MTPKTASDFAWNRTFTGQTYDPRTGMMHYRRRDYDPAMGRFTNRDPIGYDAEDVNLYRYVNNSPIIHNDPIGEAITSLDGAIEACMKLPTAAARAKCLEDLFSLYKETGGFAGDLAKLEKCAKNIRDLAEHLRKLREAQRQLSQLQKALKMAKGKKNQEALKKEIQKLFDSIKGHIKEITQKWGKGALKECECQ
jgi:RHS repeat-associated protein